MVVIDKTVNTLKSLRVLKCRPMDAIFVCVYLLYIQITKFNYNQVMINGFRGLF